MADPREKVILIVEDDESVVEFLKFAFTKEGFRLKVARDGNEALSSLKLHTPDLVVLDMMLPGKSGFDIIKLLQDDRYREIPILVVTGKYVDEATSKMVGLEPNVKGYMVKPVKTDLLLQKVHALMGTEPQAKASAVSQEQGSQDKNSPWGISI